MKKYKSTGCARFFIFLIIFAPIAYFGAAYINGEDGMAKIKELFGSESAPMEQVDEDNEQKSEEEKLRAENEKLKQKLKELEQDN